MAAALILNPAEPLAELNTTPLIDVMLVLLVMFMITIPVATHNILVDLPSTDAVSEPILHENKNRLIVTGDDRILWNAQQVTEAQLVSILLQSKAILPEPELQYAPAALASYEMSARVLNIVKSSGVTKFGFVDNEKYRTLGT